MPKTETRVRRAITAGKPQYVSNTVESERLVGALMLTTYTNNRQGLVHLHSALDWIEKEAT